MGVLKNLKEKESEAIVGKSTKYLMITLQILFFERPLRRTTYRATSLGLCPSISYVATY